MKVAATTLRKQQHLPSPLSIFIFIFSFVQKRFEKAMAAALSAKDDLKEVKVSFDKSFLKIIFKSRRKAFLQFTKVCLPILEQSYARSRAISHFQEGNAHTVT